MRTALVHSVATLWLALLAAPSHAETIEDSTLGFTLELSSEFTPRPDLVGAMPDIVHAFQFGEAAEGEVATLLLIEKMGGTIGRKRLRPEDLPPESRAKLFVTTWSGFEIDGFKIPETIDGVETITCNVQIPLKREAIQVKLFGPADRADALQPLLRQILGGLEGKSNWLTSAAPAAIAGSDSYGTVLLCLGIGGLAAGVVVLWLISRWSPGGTVLLIAVLLYALSWQIDHVHVREMRLLAGLVRLLGIAGLILGFVDLRRTRKAKSASKQPGEPEPPGPN